MEELLNHIDGRPRPGSGAPLEVTNPATEETVARYAETTAADLDAAVAVAGSAFGDRGWADTTPAERANLLNGLAARVRDGADALCDTESRETGKPLEKVMRAAELPLIVDALQFFAAIARDPSGLRAGEFAPGRTSFARREPIGIAGLIVPWNYPLMTAVWKVGAALAAGCTVVLKPAPQTPGSALLLARYAGDAGVPPGVLNVVLGHVATGQAMAEHPDIRVVSATGSPRTGRDVMTRAAGTLKRIALELGGKAPVVVCADADVDAAAQTTALCMTVNTGQDCIAATRVYVHQDRYQQFVQRLTDAVAQLSVGDPLDPDTDVGPLITAAHRDRVDGYVREAVALGARVVLGGKPVGERGWFYAPTVLTDVPPQARLDREEVFGPVISVAPVPDESVAVVRANAVDYALAASVWTRDLDRAHRVSRQLAAGTVWINDHLTLVPEFPHSGRKASGSGVDLSPDALREFQTVKHVMIRHGGAS